MFLLVRVSIDLLTICLTDRGTYTPSSTPTGIDDSNATRIWLCTMGSWRLTAYVGPFQSVRANSCHPNSQCSYILCSTYIVDGGDYRRPITWLYWAVRISDETRSDFWNFSVEEGLESCVLSVLSVRLDCMGLLNRRARRVEAVSLAAVATVCSHVQCTQYVCSRTQLANKTKKPLLLFYDCQVLRTGEYYSLRSTRSWSSVCSLSPCSGKHPVDKGLHPD